MESKLAYHLAELEIARSVSDPRRTLPTIPRGAQRLLDVGCGMGQTLVCLEGDFQRFGIDLDLEAVSAGRLATAGIEFAVAQGQNIPFRSDRFDFLICRISLPYMPVRQVLGEFQRVLVSGGGVWIVLNSIAVPRQRLIEAIRGLRFKDVLFQLYVVANGAAFHFSGRTFPWPLGRGGWESFQTVNSSARALAEAGFSSINVRRSGRAIICTARKPRAVSITGNRSGGAGE